jgi:hypothetical protein
LEEWVNHELEGYPDGASAPAYRGPFQTLVLGDFLGMMNSGISNLAIPPMTLPEEMRDTHLFRHTFLDPVAELEHLAVQSSVQLSWPADAVRIYNGLVAQGKIQRIVRDDMVLTQITRPIHVAQIVGVLDAVRGRVLDLALRLEKVAPDAGQPDASAETKRQAAQVVNNFYGTATNVAISSTGVTQTQTVQLPAAGDEAALMRFLEAVGVAPARLIDLQTALVEDREQAVAEGVTMHEPGSRVKQWILGAGTDLAVNTAGGMLAADIPSLIQAAFRAFFGG